VYTRCGLSTLKKDDDDDDDDDDTAFRKNPSAGLHIAPRRHGIASDVGTGVHVVQFALGFYNY